MHRFHSSASRLHSIARQQRRLCELVIARARAADAAAARRLVAAMDEHRTCELAIETALQTTSDGPALLSLQRTADFAVGMVSQCRAARRRTAEELTAAIAGLRAQQARTEGLARLETRHHDAWRHTAALEFSQGVDEQAARRRPQPQRHSAEVTHG